MWYYYLRNDESIYQKEGVSVAEPEDIRIEEVEDREWSRLRDTVDQGYVDLEETYEEYLARTRRAEEIRGRYESKFDEDRPAFKVVEE